MKLVNLTDLSPADIRAIWHIADGAPAPLAGSVGWSFEGNGIRTRTTFIQAFRDLGLSWVELPNLLKTAERVADLAGYLDEFHDLYVVRESDHARLAAFAAASRRPVVNAMSAAGHPCEVLADAYFIERHVGAITSLRIGLWGPPTNVLRSWHELAGVLGLQLHHFCPARFHGAGTQASFSADADTPVDLLVTDAWPKDFEDAAWSLTPAHLARLGQPRLLPTPPFTIGRELAFDPVPLGNFLGYAQKRALLPVQRALLSYLMRPAGYL